MTLQLSFHQKSVNKNKIFLHLPNTLDKNQILTVNNRASTKIYIEALEIETNIDKKLKKFKLKIQTMNNIETKVPSTTSIQL